MGFKVLGGSWVVMSGVISPLAWVMTVHSCSWPTYILEPPLITTHEPPSGDSEFRVRRFGFWI